MVFHNTAINVATKVLGQTVLHTFFFSANISLCEGLYELHEQCVNSTFYMWLLMPKNGIYQWNQNVLLETDTTNFTQDFTFACIGCKILYKEERTSKISTFLQILGLNNV
jgi:hypothetical protein